MNEMIEPNNILIDGLKSNCRNLSLNCIEAPIVLFDIDLENDEPVSLSFEVDLDEKPVVLHE